MNRVLLIHWNKAEAQERADRLRSAGFAVDVFSRDVDPATLRAFGNDPPDAYVIDLSRLPSHGRTVAVALRQQKATRLVPLVFAEGDPEITARVRELLPDASFCTWGRIRGVLRKALERPTAAPIVPKTMDAYSSVPLPKKLGIKPDSGVALLGAPDGFEELLGDAAKTARIRRDARGAVDLTVLFATTRAELERRFAAAVKAVRPGGTIWIAWPKKKPGVQTSLTQPVLRQFALLAGWVDFKVCAIDDTWSGLRFTRKK